jgi:hypothetical protein
MKFAPRWDFGQVIALAATLVAVLLSGVTVRATLHSAVGPGALALLLLSLLLVTLTIVSFIYTVSFWMLSYGLNRNGLVISGGLFHLLVPMSSIEGVYGMPADFNPFPFRGLRFRGHSVGFQTTPGDRFILYLATAAPQDCLYITTAKRIYAISPAEPQEFLRSYAAESALAPVVQWRESVRVSPALLTLAWRDYLSLGLSSGALVLGLVLLAMVFWVFPHLPSSIPMHFDTLGRPDRLARPDELFYLPLIGSIVVMLNSVLAILYYRRERLLSYFLWGGAGLVQVLLILSLRSIVG